MESKITAKGQMTLPKEARLHMNVKAGDRVKIFFEPDGHVVLLPVVPVTALKGILKSRRRRPPTMEEMDDAIAEGIVARYRRATRK
jgi:AbrB family looped-hinge helix DNA binding protein